MSTEATFLIFASSSLHNLQRLVVWHPQFDFILYFYLRESAFVLQVFSFLSYCEPVAVDSAQLYTIYLVTLESNCCLLNMFEAPIINLVRQQILVATATPLSIIALLSPLWPRQVL